MPDQLRTKFDSFRERAEASVPVTDFTPLESRGIKLRRTRYTIGAVVVASVIAVGAGVAVGVGDQDTESIEPVTPDTRSEPAVATAEDFLDAYNAHDADRIMALMAPGTDVISRMSGIRDTTPEERAETLLAIEESRSTDLVREGDCEVTGSGADRVSVSCPFAFHAMGSRELGLGPYPGGTWEFTVLDGEIHHSDPGGFHADGPHFVDEAFRSEVLEPYGEWLAANGHDTGPEDNVQRIMAAFNWGTLTEADRDELLDWDRQRIAEYVASVTGSE